MQKHVAGMWQRTTTVTSQNWVENQVRRNSKSQDTRTPGKAGRISYKWNPQKGKFKM